MRVLTLTPLYPTARDDAAGCFTAEPLQALEDFGVRSSVVAVRPIYRGFAEPSPRPPVAEWVHYPCIPGGVGLSSAGIFLHWRLMGNFQETCFRNSIDLIHAHAALPCGHAAMLIGRKLGIPYTVTVHGLDAYLRNQISGFAGRLCERISRSVYASASRVICVSKAVRDEVDRVCELRPPASVVYNGVDSNKFRPPADEHEGMTVLVVGNLISIKGHDLLLRAFAEVKNQLPGISCEIVGDGPELGRLKNLACQLGIEDRVFFLGQQSRDTVAEAMRRCTLFVLPSRYEALGCVYLEAMSSAKPVIACRGQGIEEIIEHGQNGWLIEPRDLAGLTHGMLQLLTDRPLRQRLGEAARESILQGLTLSHQAQRLSDLYRECAA